MMNDLTPNQIIYHVWRCRPCRNKYLQDYNRRRMEVGEYDLKHGVCGLNLGQIRDVRLLEKVNGMAKISYLSGRLRRKATTWLPEAKVKDLI